MLQSQRWPECEFVSSRPSLVLTTEGIICYRALQDAIVALSNPITGLDGTEMQQVAIPKGTNIFISALNANRNPDLWGQGVSPLILVTCYEIQQNKHTDALEWKPERCLSPLPDALLEAHIPGVYSHLLVHSSIRLSHYCC